MTTKHTPGPWMFGVTKVNVGLEGAPIWGYILIGNYWSMEQAEANLPLMNAAPELLAELNNVLDAWRRKRMSPRQKREIFERALNLIDRLES